MKKSNKTRKGDRRTLMLLAVAAVLVLALFALRLV